MRAVFIAVLFILGLGYAAFFVFMANKTTEPETASAPSSSASATSELSGERSVEAAVRIAADALNRGGPKEASPWLTLRRADANGRTLILDTQLGITGPSLREMFESEAAAFKQNACRDPRIRELIRLGVELTVRIHDSAGSHVTDMQVTDCP